MGKDTSAPPAPDYAAAAQAQGAANVDAARIQGRMNNPNIITPYGTQTVTWGNQQPQYQLPSNLSSQLRPEFTDGVKTMYGGEDGTTPYYMNADGSPASGPSGGGVQQRPQGMQQSYGGINDQPTITQTLNPESQKIFDAQQQTRLGLANLSNTGTGIAQGVLNKPFSFNGPDVQTSLGQRGNIQNGLDTSGISKMPLNAGMTAQDAILSRLEPQFARQRTSLETQLTNQGLRPGSEAWDNAMKDFSQQQTDQRTQAAAQGLGLDMQANNQGYNQALQSGQFTNSAQNQDFNQGLQAGQFGNSAQQQAMAQALQQRALPLNEITALMSGSQIQNPQFQGYQGSNVAPAPVMQGVQAQAGAAQNSYNASQAGSNAAMGGLFGLGAAALGAPTGTFTGANGLFSLLRG